MTEQGPANVATTRPILRWPKVHSATGRSRTQAWRDIRAGTFPAPIELGENAVGWYEDEIVAWQKARPRVAYAPDKEAA